MSLVADTLQAITRNDTTAVIGLFISGGTFALALFGLAWRGGGMAKEIQANREAAEKQIADMKDQFGREIRDMKNALAEQDQHAITREELDARFGEVKAQLSAVKDRMDDVVDIFKEAIKR